MACLSFVLVCFCLSVSLPRPVFCPSLSVCLSIGSYVCLSVHPPVHLSVCLLACLHISVRPSMCLLSSLSVCPCLSFPICLSACLPALCLHASIEFSIISHSSSLLDVRYTENVAEACEHAHLYVRHSTKAIGQLQITCEAKPMDPSMHVQHMVLCFRQGDARPH